MQSDVSTHAPLHPLTHFPGAREATAIVFGSKLLVGSGTYCFLGIGCLRMSERKSRWTTLDRRRYTHKLTQRYGRNSLRVRWQSRV